MAKQPTRLRFTEADLAGPQVAKAAARADKAAGKAEKAVQKLTVTRKTVKLRLETDAAAARRGKLRFEKAAVEEMADRPSRGKQWITRSAMAALSSRAHRAAAEHQEDSVGVQAVQETTGAVEAAGYAADHAIYSHKLKAHDKADKLVGRSDRANVDALFQQFQKDNPQASSNPISRWRQRQAIKKEYAAAKSGGSAAKTTGTAAKGTGKAARETESVAERIASFVKGRSKLLWIVLMAGLLVIAISGMFSSCTAMFSGGGQVILGTSFTAEDEDILGAEADYAALEAALRQEIGNISSTHSDYDEYRFDLDEINHNPYELAAYLTVLFEDYTREEVQDTLRQIFEAQYALTLAEEVETRTRTETRTGVAVRTDPETGETYEEEYEYEAVVEYEYRILHVKLENKGLGGMVASAGLTEDQRERYALLLQTKGNRPDLFADNIYAATGEYTDYDIPGEALTDTRFANMIREAEKYLGYPYVWGGSSPSTSFDCSGFVSWVINNCGNGWSVGRRTANGLMDVCDIIPRSAAEPGDLIFFQGTYDTSGASHVGIYVGDGMMIHCGNPISYASTETSYWQSHVYCFGRI